MSRWVRACGNATCIEVLKLRHFVMLRVSGERDAVIAATGEEWLAFVAAVKAGAFDQVDDKEVSP